MKRTLMLAAAILAFGISEVVQAQALGRLFFTPQQRQQLDRQRALNIDDTRAPITQPDVNFSGQIKRSDGRVTTWINGVPDFDPRYSGSNGRPPKVGQTRDLNTGQITDGLQGGSVEIERTPKR